MLNFNPLELSNSDHRTSPAQGRRNTGSFTTPPLPLDLAAHPKLNSVRFSMHLSYHADAKLSAHIIWTRHDIEHQTCRQLGKHWTKEVNIYFDDNQREKAKQTSHTFDADENVMLHIGTEYKCEQLYSGPHIAIATHTNDTVTLQIGGRYMTESTFKQFIPTQRLIPPIVRESGICALIDVLETAHYKHIHCFK